MCCSFCTFALAEDDTFRDTFSDSGSLTEDIDKTSDLALFALSLLGIQYKYGGSSPHEGLDCSGLVRHVVREVMDQELPRSSEEISRIGNPVDNHALQPGDLVFFNTLRRSFSHVGIYLGDDRFIHSPASGGKVRIENMALRYWKQRFDGARRIAARPEGLQ